MLWPKQGFSNNVVSKADFKKFEEISSEKNWLTTLFYKIDNIFENFFIRQGSNGSNAYCFFLKLLPSFESFFFI